MKEKQNTSSLMNQKKKSHTIIAAIILCVDSKLTEGAPQTRGINA